MFVIGTLHHQQFTKCLQNQDPGHSTPFCKQCRSRQVCRATSDTERLRRAALPKVVLYEAVNPSCCTDPSDTKLTSSELERVLMVSGGRVPQKRPMSGAYKSSPSYTATQSYTQRACASRLNALNLRRREHFVLFKKDFHVVWKTMTLLLSVPWCAVQFKAGDRQLSSGNWCSSKSTRRPFGSVSRPHLSSTARSSATVMCHVQLAFLWYRGLVGVSITPVGSVNTPPHSACRMQGY